VRYRTFAQWLAGGVPWIAYVLSCSSHAYWLDSGEFVAASVRLDISHPPGHPLTELYGKAFSLLPLGSLPMRIAIGQAFATALACVFVCLASAEVLALQRVPERYRWPCAVFAAWVSAFTYGLWFQAVRPEVYALQTACTSVVMERVCAFLRARASAEPGAESAVPQLHAARYAGPACFALGLGLANHHFTALFVMPAMLVPAWVLVRSGRRRAVLGSAALGALALATYVYLPLRAAHALPANLGQPDSFARFVWVVSAKVYQHGAATQTTQPFAERLADVMVLLVQSYRGLPLAAAVVGLYALLRTRSSRATGGFLLLLSAAMLIARAWLGPVRSNPDVLGYFGSAFLAIGMLAASAIGELLKLLDLRSPDRPPDVVRGAVAWCLPLLALFNLPAAVERSSLADFHATDSVDELRLRSLPARSIVVETMPQTVFRHWELDAVERIRPDVVQVPVPFLTHPGMHEALLARAPSARSVVDGYLKGDVLRCEDLEAAAAHRTTWVELDVRVPPACFPRLAPAHLLHRVTGKAPQPSAAERKAWLDWEYAVLYRDVGVEALDDPETVRQLLAVHYLSAVQFAAAGNRKLAVEEIERARALAPEDKNVRALAAALTQGEGPLVIAPFLEF
jgi:Protein of unknown function (DUF2723)